MLRESYYQDIGNPVQWGRLPARSNFVRLPFWGDAAADVQSSMLKLMLGICTIDLLGWCILLQFGTTDLRRLFVGCVLTVGAILFTSSMLQGKKWLFPVAIVLTGGLAFSVFLPNCESIRLIVGGIVLCGLAYCFAEHWIELCTTDPMNKTVAAKLKQAWYGHLNITLLVTVFSSIIATYLNLPWLFLFFLVLYGLAQILVVVRERHALRGPIQAFTSWYTYNCNDSQVPGIFKSPSGNLKSRQMMTLGAALVMESCLRTSTAIVGITRLHSPLLIFAIISLGPVILTLPILIEASRRRSKHVNSSNWKELTANLRSSPNPIERQGYYAGRVVKDGSLLNVPRTVFGEHAHFLGGSGAGKTSLGLSPWIEQTIGFGDCSIIVIDLKADTNELLATLVGGAEQLRQERGIDLPLKVFSNQDDRFTHGFNPLCQPNWKQFNDYIKTDILCGATGLEYGPDYGAGFYSSANAAVLHHTFKSFPNIKNFQELADRCGYVLNNSDNRDLHPEIRRSGIHVHEVLKRLAAFDALNVASGHCSTEVLDHAMDLSDVFRKPQLQYFHLSSTLSPGASPALARLVTYFLLASAVNVNRQVPVYLVIDEFQRMVAQNTEYMLQLARSMGVGVILANQSMEDLRTLKSNLIPAIESNCRYRQWFDVPSAEDRRRITECGGECVELKSGYSRNSEGSSSISTSEVVMPRLSPNDISLASDHPKRSIVRLSRGAGYAQWGGFPVIVQSDYHISESEFNRRKAMPWPSSLPGTFVPNDSNKSVAQRHHSPVVTTEVIERKRDLFTDLLPPQADQPGSKRIDK